MVQQLSDERDRGFDPHKMKKIFIFKGVVYVCACVMCALLPIHKYKNPSEGYCVSSLSTNTTKKSDRN